MCNYAQNSSPFKDGSNPRPMISFDPKFFKVAGRSSSENIWRRCFEERIVEVSVAKCRGSWVNVVGKKSIEKK